MSEHKLGSEMRPLRVAIIGSGPSGFYAAGALQNAEIKASIDMYDRLPTPFGLVRGGVAPDHQKIKNVTRKYEKIASDSCFRFFGNVCLGQDVQVCDLQAHYDHIIYAVGNESDRKMGVEGENLQGVFSATEFVGWYNGHPDFRDRKFNLSEASRVAVVGNGNVAMDVARVIARAPSELASTDIAAHALSELTASAVKEVLLLGRRGPAQAAFSPSEIKEIGNLESADLVIPEDIMNLDDVTTNWLENYASRDALKNVAYLKQKATEGEGNNERKITCHFLASPTSFEGENGRVTAIKLVANELYADERGTPRPRATETTWLEPVDLVFKAIGYRGVEIPGVPYHKEWGTIPNIDGRVTEYENEKTIPGQYVVGWAKRGPTGLIGTNKADSESTVRAMLEDISGQTVDASDTKSPEAALKMLQNYGIDVVTLDDWHRLDQDEIQRGESVGKIREKYTCIDEMMAAIRRLRN